MIDTIGRLYELIEKNHLTLSGLCDISGVNRSTVTSARRRNVQLTVDTIERFCDGMNMPIKDFFDFGSENQEANNAKRQ